MTTNLPSKAQTLSLIVCMTLVIASISIPLSVYESLERQVKEWMKDRQAENLMVSLFDPAIIAALREFQSYESNIFAPFEWDQELDVTGSGISDTVYYFTSARIAALQALPHVERITWSRGYFSCDYYVSGYPDNFYLTLISPGFFEFQGMQLAHGRGPTESDPPHVAVLGSEAAQILFGSPEAAIGQEIPAGEMSGENCKKTLTVIGVLAPTEETNTLEKWNERSIFIPDLETLDMPQDRAPLVQPVSSIWVTPKQGHQREAIAEILDYFQQESGDNIYVQITPLREYYQSAGGIQARLAYLPYIGIIVALVAFVASLNMGLIIYARVNKNRYEIGVRRSLGASRLKLLGEQTTRLFPYWIIATGAGMILSLALAPLIGRFFQTHYIGEPFPVSLGPLTATFAGVTGIIFGSAVTLVAVRIFLRNSSTALLRDRDLPVSGSVKEKLRGGAGLAVGTLALIILFGLRDGAIIHFDRILGWSGGERAGAIVDWMVTSDFNEKNADITYADYLFLSEHFPEAQFGWLGRKGLLSSARVIEASASINVIRPPVMLAGEWITDEDEKQQRHVAVLGRDLAQQLATQREMNYGGIGRPKVAYLYNHRGYG